MLKFLSTFSRSFESRDESATDRLIQALQSGALLREADALATAAVETAAGIIGRALASAQVSGDNGLVTPNVLFAMGRALIRGGEYVAIENASMLRQASIHEVKGGVNPETWRYELAVPVPQSQNAISTFALGDFVFVKYIDNGVRGSAPIDVADASATILANLTQRLGEETGTPVGFLLPIPARDGASANVASLRNTIAQMKGRILTVESAQSLANTAGFTRTAEWETKRIGANPPQTIVEMLREIYEQIISLCGVPLAIVNASAQREAWRQFIFGTVAPIGKIIETEMREKVRSNFTLSFEELRASDITGRARAFQSLVGAGMDLSQAASLSGLLVNDA